MAEHLHSSLTLIFPLQLLLDLLGAGAVRAHESQQPLLQVGRRSETETEEQDRCEFHGLCGLMAQWSDGQKTTPPLLYRVRLVHQRYLAAPSDDGLNWEFLSRKSRRPRSSRITDSRSSRLTLLSSCTYKHEEKKHT